MTTKAPTKNPTSPIGRVSYPHLFAPTLNKLKKSAEHPAGTPEYSVDLIFPPGTDLSELIRICDEKLTERFGRKPAQGWVNAGFKIPIKKCDDVFKKKGEYPEGMMPGGHYISFRSEIKPKVVDQQLGPIMEKGQVYGGCYGRVSFGPYTYDTGGNRGVNFGLRNFKLEGDGDRLGGGHSDPETDFAPPSRGHLEEQPPGGSSSELL